MKIQYLGHVLKTNRSWPLISSYYHCELCNIHCIREYNGKFINYDTSDILSCKEQIIKNIIE